MGAGQYTSGRLSDIARTSAKRAGDAQRGVAAGDSPGATAKGHVLDDGYELSRASMKPKSKLSIFRSIRDLRNLLCSHGLTAETFVGTVLSLWCGHDYPALKGSALPSSWALKAEPKLVAWVEFLRHADFLESTYWLSSAYAMLSDEAQRQRLAMFFTPPSLTRGLLGDLVAQGANFSTDTFFDPACGGAAFLAPIALRMREELRAQGKTASQIVLHVESHLFGTDIEPTLCAMSRHFLRMALHDEIRESGLNPYFQVTTGDSLKPFKSTSAEYKVVVCNPPYRKMTALELEPLRASFGNIIEAQPNIYALFIAKCVDVVAEGGLVGLVTPTSFLSGQYFRKLRTYILENTDVAHIGMVSERQGVFIDVEQETALCILRKHAHVQALPGKAKVSVVSGKGTYTDVGECALPNSGAAWPIPRALEDVALLARAEGLTSRVKDYGYRVRIGLFVWNRDERASYPSKKLAKKAMAHTAVPLLWSKDIVVKGRDAKVAFQNDESNLDKHTFVDLGSKDQPGVITRPSVVLQRVTSNDQPLRLVAAAVPRKLFAQHGGFVGENHIVILEQEGDSPQLTPRQMAEVLRSRPVDRYFRCISGATNVSAFELSQLVLPDPAVLKLEMQKGGTVDAAVHRAFGLLVSK